MCPCFDFLHGPWLFRTCFHTKFLVSVSVRNNSRIAVSSPSNLLWKLWIWVFWILCFVIISFNKQSCKARFKITLPKTKSTQTFRDIKACVRVKTRRRQNVKFIVTNCKVYKLNHKLQYLHTNIRSSYPEVFCEKGVLENCAKFTEQKSTFVRVRVLQNIEELFFLQNTPAVCFLNMPLFELSSVISKVLVSDFEHVFVCWWGRYRITIAVLRIIEKPYPANNSLLKVNNRNPKTRCGIC